MINIRKLIKEDLLKIHENFLSQGWQKDFSILQTYYNEHIEGIKTVYVASKADEICGYGALIHEPTYGPHEKKTPMIFDLNVFKKYQRQNIASKLMDALEDHAKKISDHVILGVGLYSGYGPAQILYVKRGYVPDGSGIWLKDRSVNPYETVVCDDDLNLYFIKNLKE